MSVQQGSQLFYSLNAVEESRLLSSQCTCQTRIYGNEPQSMQQGKGSKISNAVRYVEQNACKNFLQNENMQNMMSLKKWARRICAVEKSFARMGPRCTKSFSKELADTQVSLATNAQYFVLWL